MNKFGDKSKRNLESCRKELQLLFNEIVPEFDCSVLCGTRSEYDQNEAFKHNRSTKKFPESKHNTSPSIAVDVVPFPIDWENISRFYFFGGYVKAKAEALGIKIRWGGDWDGDTMVKDQRFMDLPHFELII